MAFLHFYQIFTSLACFIFIVFYLSKLRGPIPFNWPIVGMLPSLLINIHRIHDRATDVLRKTGGTFLLKGPLFSGMDRLCTANPSNLHYVMSSNFLNFPKETEFNNIFEIFGDGIFNSDGELWKNQRKVAKAIMNHKNFRRLSMKASEDKVNKGFLPILEQLAEKGSVVDLQDLFKRFTFDTTCILVTGYDPMSLSIDLPNVPFSEAMEDAWEAIVIRHVVPQCVWKIQKWLGIGKERKMTKVLAMLDDIIYSYISAKREELSKGNGSEKDEEGVDLLTSYLNENDVTGIKRDDKFLKGNVINFLLAGRDTVSSALTWFLWLVSTHPHVESKIREELSASIPSKEAKNWHLFKLEEVNNLVYLHSAICETLRLYPPLPFHEKESIKEDVLPSGHYVKPKLKIMFSLYAMGRMESIWGMDCLKFKPERWISEQGTIKHEPSYKFSTFSTGPRSCLGKEMTFTQMKVITASIIHNYNVEVLEGHNVEFNMSIILYMKHGLKVKVSKRWS